MNKGTWHTPGEAVVHVAALASPNLPWQATLACSATASCCTLHTYLGLQVTFLESNHTPGGEGGLLVRGGGGGGLDPPPLPPPPTPQVVHILCTLLYTVHHIITSASMGHVLLEAPTSWSHPAPVVSLLALACSLLCISTAQGAALFREAS